MPPLPPLPPTSLVLTTLQAIVLPAVGGAALVVSLFAILGRWAGALGSAVAMVFAFAWSNYWFTKLEWEKTYRVFPWKLEETSAAWMYLPRVALVLVVVGLISRWLGLLISQLVTKPLNSNPTPERVGRYWWLANLVTWAPRIVAVAITSGWIVSSQAMEYGNWIRPGLAATMLLSWLILDGIARAGAGGQVAAYQFVIFQGAAMVLIYSSSERFMDVGLILSFSMLGVALAAGAAKIDASGAIPAGVAVLPGLMLNARILQEDLHKVPLVSYWLIALAPLALAPFLIPWLNRKNGWIVRIIRFGLIIIPVVVAVWIAAENETLSYPGEEW